MGFNTRKLKAGNSRLVQEALRQKRSATIRELSEETGLSAVTVGSIMPDLISAGVARELELVPSDGGRPARQFGFNPEHSLVLAVFGREIGAADSICLRVADLDGRTIAEEDYETAFDSFASFTAPIDRLVETYPRISALGIGIPGVEFEGRLLASDYGELVGSPLLEELENRYRIPVVIENDVNAAVLGVGQRDSPSESEVYLFLPEKYPPGAGIRIGDRLIKGRRNFAGEISALPLNLSWKDGRHFSPEQLIDAVTRIIVSLSAVVAPDTIVLFREHIPPGFLKDIQKECLLFLPAEVIPALSLSKDFGADFERGLICLALNLLEQESV